MPIRRNPHPAGRARAGERHSRGSGRTAVAGTIACRAPLCVVLLLALAGDVSREGPLPALAGPSLAPSPAPQESTGWDSLAVNLRAARTQARRARIRLVPAEILAAEEAYNRWLAAAGRRLRGAPAGEAPPTDGMRFLIEEVLDARDPEGLAWLADLAPAVAARIDPSGALGFWSGVEHGRQGRSAQAIEFLEGPVPDLLRPYADLTLLEILEREDPAAADRYAAARLARDGGHRFAARLLLGAVRNDLREGREAASAERLTAWLAGPGAGAERPMRAAALTLLAEAHRRLKRQGDFEAAFVRAAGTDPREPFAAELRAAQALELIRAGKDFSPNTIRWSIEVLCKIDRLDSALAAWTAHRTALAASDRGAASRALLQALYRSRRFEEMRELAGEVESTGDRASARYAALVTGRSWRGRDWDRMEEAYLRAGGRAEGASALAEMEREDAATALWELAREQEDAAAWAKAEAGYGELYGRFPDDSRAPESGLRAALCLHRAGKRDDAASALRAMCSSAPADRRAAPCLWLAFLSEGDERERLLALAASESNPGYAARRAEWAIRRGCSWKGGDLATWAGGDSAFWTGLSEEIRHYEDWPWPAGAPAVADSTAGRLLEGIEDSPIAAAGRHFLASGHAAWARELWPLLRGWNESRPGEQAALLRALGDQGEAIRAGIRSGQLLARYPVAFAPEVSAAARQAGLSPALVLALARQESLLETTALSGAGARGLMQLMPGTASRLSGLLGWTDYDLDRPADNLVLGACHLAELLDDMGGELPVALAAYNAGPEAAQRWRNRSGNLDEFIEMIGYNETRRFVKSVLMHYGFLREAYPAG